MRRYTKPSITGRESIQKIGAMSCEQRFSGHTTFSDLFSDWLIKKGVTVTSELLEAIEDCYTDAPRWVWRYNFGIYVVLKLKLPVSYGFTDTRWLDGHKVRGHAVRRRVTVED